MKVHNLKTWPGYFAAVNSGVKRFEIRLNDRDFKTGDILHLMEWRPESKTYTGLFCEVCVDYIAQGVFGLPENICVMSITKIKQRPE